MPCRACGEPKTVKSHLLPRAFAMDARADQKHLMVGMTARNGYAITQSGFFDMNILCQKHERALEKMDAYGVEFVRAFAERRENLSLKGRSFWRLRDINATLLVRFAASVLWRWSVSILPIAADVKLGIYEEIYSQVVFEEADCFEEPALGMYSMRSRNLPDETIQRIIMPPNVMRVFGVRYWGFAVGGLVFILKADRRIVPSGEALPKVNGRSDYLGEARFIEEGPEWPAVVGMIRNMGTSRKAAASSGG